MLARVYFGYKAIGLLARWKGEDWAEPQRRRHHSRSARHFYHTAVRDQGLLIKTGQFLSSRPDIVPDEYLDVLARLQDEVPPEPFPVIRGVIERELGRPLASVYRDFDETPIASASLAQVHRAVLHDGRVVAVKVQYPGIEKLVAVDLRNIETLTSILHRLDHTLDFRFVAEEMANMIPRELDFITEGRSAEAIAANFAGVDDIVVPAIYWEYTARRVLTMQFVEGVKITDAKGMRALGIDPSDVAKILVVAFSEMLLKHGIFHADPHPGNLFVAPGPKLVLVDFGQVKEIGPQFRFVFAQMTRALVAEDDSALGRTFRDLGFRMKLDTDQGYEQLGNAYVGQVARQMKESNAGWADEEMFRESFRETVRILKSNPLIKVPPDLLFVGRVMGLLNGLSLTLGSRTNMLIEMSRLLDKADGAAAEPAGTRRLLEA
jgi:predicted unusual protein kinase regulating ubiquinone biosynthesis (AarF/ABC1/UbiB family)